MSKFDVLAKCTTEQAFNKIYEKRIWSSKESASGKGSELAETVIMREMLTSFFKAFQIKSVIDCACGDFNWMKEIVHHLEKYVGIDIVKQIINQNNQTYSTDKVLFLVEDIIHALPIDEHFDLALYRDILVHLVYDDIINSIKTLQTKDVTYLLATTFPSIDKNTDLEFNGAWRPLNMSIEPFNLGPPIILINDDLKDPAEKKLGLWKL